ncbi:MFS transporter [Microbacterium pumilum]|uniref:Major facilitator superfamily (MFS) profile domain-containing protein n=1 Tax=Microbacterium pumilum TaxID=344165 RepID=A0ABP5EI04_9MICO
MPQTTALPTVSPQRTPRGYVLTFSLSNFGLYLAVLAPAVGGLSVKIQSLVGLDAAPSQLGLVVGVASLFALIAQPIAGRLSDRTTSKFGMRRPWIIAGATATTIALVFCGLAPNVGLLLVWLCVAQTTVQFAFAAQGATLADQVPEERRGGVSGIVGAISPISLVVGAVLLTLLPTDLLRFAVPALIGMVLALIFAFTLKDRVRVNPPHHAVERQAGPFRVRVQPAHSP